MGAGRLALEGGGAGKGTEILLGLDWDPVPTENTAD